MAAQSPLGQRKVTWIVDVGEAPAHTRAPYEKHVHHSKCKYHEVNLILSSIDPSSDGTQQT